jgi:hypothetical protein
MALPVLDFETVANFEADPTHLPVEAFAQWGQRYVGREYLYPADEIAWDFGDVISGDTVDPTRGWGRWHGPAPRRWGAANMRLDGGSLEFEGHDELARHANPATAVTLVWDVAADGATGTAVYRSILQNGATGAIVDDHEQPVSLGAVTAQRSYSVLAAGNYIAWCRVETPPATPTQVLPPDYYTLTGYANYEAMPTKYKYRVGSAEYLWDWLHDVGVRPASRLQVALDGVTVMWDEYAALLAAGTLEDRSEWTRYIIGTPSGGGQWSALRIVVGDGDWQPGSIVPAPGAVLLRGGTTAVPIDPLALSVSAWANDDDGALLAGSVATRSGPVLALWRMAEDETTTLLGTHPNETNHVCEFALLGNFASDVRRDVEGRILVLTLGGLHRYDDSAATIPEALPGLPPDTEGHPGGRCLRELKGQLLFMTENFGSELGNFYNRLQEQTAGRRGTGPGTVAHVHNAAETLWGEYLGIYQDSHNFSTANQYLAALRSGAWSPLTSAWPSAAYRWQRVAAMGTQEGLRLLMQGKRATSEEAIWAVADGQAVKESRLNFRPRRLTRALDSDGEERIFAVGRAVSQEGGTWQVSTQWSVIAITGLFKTVCMFWDDTDGAFVVSVVIAEAGGLDTDMLPAFLWWHPDGSNDAGGVWVQKTAVPEGDTVYLEKSVAGGSLLYALGDGQTLPYAVKWEWSALQNAYVISTQELSRQGIATTQLPAFLVWNSGTNKWEPSDINPESGYVLQKQQDVSEVTYHPI